MPAKVTVKPLRSKRESSRFSGPHGGAGDPITDAVATKTLNPPLLCPLAVWQPVPGPADVRVECDELAIDCAQRFVLRGADALLHFREELKVPRGYRFSSVHYIAPPWQRRFDEKAIPPECSQRTLYCAQVCTNMIK
jgi:hypothetical protein